MFEMVVKKVEITTYLGKNRQTILLAYPKTKDEFLFIVNQKIDLTKFKRNDRVNVSFKISKKGSLNAPHFFIESLEHVILKDEVHAHV